MPHLAFSIVICTHNRAQYLAKALAGVARQDFPTDQFEVLVIDNASTDETKLVVDGFQGRDHNLHYVYEAKLGLSIARNTGWRKAAGQYIAYLDDDAIPSETWLTHAANAIEQRNHDIGMLGGRVEPIWEQPRPEWLDDQLLSLLSMVDLGPTTQYVDDDFGIVGANMIIPRHLLEQFGGFSSEVGRIGNLLLSGEETLLKRRLAKAGYRGYYSPDVSVQHHAPADRLTKKWFLERMYWQGRSSAALMRLEDTIPWSRRAPKSALELLKAAILFVGSLVPGQKFVLRARANGHLGLAEGLCQSGASQCD
ncbi:MAG: glycosyltransferase [Erythrobacter sp.]